MIPFEQLARTAAALSTCRHAACVHKGKRGGTTVFLPGLVETQIDPEQLALIPGQLKVSPDEVAAFWCEAVDYFRVMYGHTQKKPEASK